MNEQANYANAIAYETSQITLKYQQEPFPITYKVVLQMWGNFLL